jgi:hypothetical protein
VAFEDDLSIVLGQELMTFQFPKSSSNSHNLAGSLSSKLLHLSSIVRFQMMEKSTFGFSSCALIYNGAEWNCEASREKLDFLQRKEKEA